MTVMSALTCNSLLHIISSARSIRLSQFSQAGLGQEGEVFRRRQAGTLAAHDAASGSQVLGKHGFHHFPCLQF